MKTLIAVVALFSVFTLPAAANGWGHHNVPHYNRPPVYVPYYGYGGGVSIPFSIHGNRGMINIPVAPVVPPPSVSPYYNNPCLSFYDPRERMACENGRQQALRREEQRRIEEARRLGAQSVNPYGGYPYGSYPYSGTYHTFPYGRY